MFTSKVKAWLTIFGDHKNKETVAVSLFSASFLLPLVLLVSLSGLI